MYEVWAKKDTKHYLCGTYASMGEALMLQDRIQRQQDTHTVYVLPPAFRTRLDLLNILTETEE